MPSKWHKPTHTNNAGRPNLKEIYAWDQTTLAIDVNELVLVVRRSKVRSLYVTSVT